MWGEQEEILAIPCWIPTGPLADLPLFLQHLYRALALVLRRGSVSCGLCVQVWLCPVPLCGLAQRLNPSQLWDQVFTDIALIYVATHASR